MYAPDAELDRWRGSVELNEGVEKSDEGRSAEGWASWAGEGDEGVAMINSEALANSESKF